MKSMSVSKFKCIGNLVTSDSLNSTTQSMKKNITADDFIACYSVFNLDSCIALGMNLQISVSRKPTV